MPAVAQLATALPHLLVPGGGATAAQYAVSVLLLVTNVAEYPACRTALRAAGVADALGLLAAASASDADAELLRGAADAALCALQ